MRNICAESHGKGSGEIDAESLKADARDDISECLGHSVSLPVVSALSIRWSCWFRASVGSNECSPSCVRWRSRRSGRRVPYGGLGPVYAARAETRRAVLTARMETERAVRSRVGRPISIAVMLSPRFKRLFQRLLVTFIAYDEAPRTVDRLPELAAARTELDQARSEIADERRVIHQRTKRARLVKKTAISDEDVAVLQVRGPISG